MLETSFQHTHNISMTGGTDKLRYRLSAGFIDNDGVLITDKDKYRRMNVSGFISANVTKWFTQEATFSYAHSKRMEPKSALGAVYSTRLASFYPEGNMPEGISAAGDGLPFFTPSNQIRWSNPEKTLYDNPRIFLKSILKPLKGFEIAFEYNFRQEIYMIIAGIREVWYILLCKVVKTRLRPMTIYKKRKDIPTITQSTCMVLMISHWVIISLR